MQTEVSTPEDIFFNILQYEVPLFQRPYVWNEEEQWAYLWEDITTTAEAEAEGQKPGHHFLGAIVLQEQSTQPGEIKKFLVVDGQQRLTTLQIIIDAVRRSLEQIGHSRLAKKLTGLVRNSAEYTRSEVEKFKVLPTNKDRSYFLEAMSGNEGTQSQISNALHSKIIQAHAYFKREADAWLAENQSEKFAEAIVNTIFSGIEIVTITLTADENPQQIFETLNARGNPLTAVDLIKNFIFQSLSGNVQRQEVAYDTYWKDFEDNFWTEEIGVGRLKISRSLLFFTHWLVAKTMKEVNASEVFDRFKQFFRSADRSMEQVLASLNEIASVYRDNIEKSTGSLSTVETVPTFTYRANALSASTVTPLLIWLLDPELSEIPQEQLEIAIATLESWLIRRFIVSANSKNYNRFLTDLIKKLSESNRETAGTKIQEVLTRETSEYTYWPSDEMVIKALSEYPTYTRLKSGPTRMILEAIEDFRRGFPAFHNKHEQPIPRNKCDVEHIMPQKWESNWPKPVADEQVDRLTTVNLLGNLTLVTGSLNKTLSNAPWLGSQSKRKALETYTSILLTREVLEMSQKNWAEDWTDDLIVERTKQMANELIQIWPSPTKHKSIDFLRIIAPTRSPGDSSSRTTIKQLLDGGYLNVGQNLYAIGRKHEGSTCTVTETGTLKVGDKEFDTPSGAGKAITLGQSIGGWTFWKTSANGNETLDDLRIKFSEKGLDT